MAPLLTSLLRDCSAAHYAAAILDEMLEGVDLQADVEAVLAEDHALSAALQAAAAAEAAAAVSQEQQAGGEPAGAPQEGGGVALLDEDMEDEAEALPGVASFLLINSKRGGSEGGGPVSGGWCACPDCLMLAWGGWAVSWLCSTGRRPL